MRQALADIVEALSNADASFHLTGGLVSSFYGEPRFTQDIDIVIRVDAGSALDRLVVELQRRFILDPEVVGEAVRREDMFQALHVASIIKVDFHVGEAVPGELGRSRKIEVLPGLVVPAVSR